MYMQTSVNLFEYIYFSFFTFNGTYNLKKTLKGELTKIEEPKNDVYFMFYSSIRH